MIAIDMPMPKSCEKCPVMGMHLLRCEKFCRIASEKKVGEAQKVVKRRPQWCPLIDLTDDGKQASYRQVKLTWRYARKETAAK